MRSCLWVLLSLLPCGGATDSIYPIRSASRQRRSLIDNDLSLTFSDDGRMKSMPEFLLLLFETDGGLGADDILAVEEATDDFLKQEMNAFYPLVNTPYEVEEVETKILEQNNASYTPPQRRDLDNERTLQGTLIGSELRVLVNITFDEEPSPSVDEVALLAKDLMMDLSNFLNILRAKNRPELANVRMAIREEISEEAPTPSPVSTNRIEDPPPNKIGARSTGRESQFIIFPTVIGAAALVTLTAYFVLRKKKRHDPPNKNDPHGKLAYLDVESDLHSIDRSLQSSPPRSARPQSPPDSLFEGIDSDTSSSSSIPGVKSAASAATVKASNVQEYSLAGPAVPGRSPSSAAITALAAAAPMTLGAAAGQGNSLFAFSEEDEEEEGSVDVPAMATSDVSDGESMEDKSASPSAEKSRVSVEDFDVGKSSWCNSMSPLRRALVPAAAAGASAVNASQHRQETGSVDSYSKTPLKRNTSTNGKVDTQIVDGTPAGPKSAVIAGGVVGSNGSVHLSQFDGDDMGSTAGGSTIDSPYDLSGAFPRLSTGTQGRRRHAEYKSSGDGTSMYQMNAMHPLDWSNQSGDGMSIGDSSWEGSEGGIPRHLQARRKTLDSHPSKNSKSPLSYSSQNTRGGFSTLSGSARTPKSATSPNTETSSQVSASRQLINDLVWLEKKIADVRQSTSGSIEVTALPMSPPAIEATDSLSYTSNDAMISPSSNDETGSKGTISPKALQSIVCRDCYAPPGKLQILIHSTKDGPAVKTVHEGSNLEGHIFPGDLIISVDNVDTRAYTAEQVMNLMVSNCDTERKITVLHFEE